MGQDALDRHQLAGYDDRERGFSRPVEFERSVEGFQAILRYERLRIATEPQPSQDEALRLLVRTLQAQGYRQLRTQLNCHNGIYLGSQELWIEYPDSPSPAHGVLAKCMNWLRAHTTQS